MPSFIEAWTHVRTLRVVGEMHQPSSRSPADFSLAIVLSGGNALGAYQGGAYQALHERQMEPDWVSGASAGAINGAVICGNAPEQRLERLASLWHTKGADALPSAGFWEVGDEARRTSVAALTLAGGQPDWFVPRALYGPWWNPFANTEPASLYDASPLEARVAELIDFDRLNAGTPRFQATAVDVETGGDIFFDNTRHAFTPRHLRACGALLPAFSPVEVEGRLVADAGVSANLPLDAVLGERFDRPLLCIAIDLLPLSAPAPKTLGDTVTRMQDLMFATQSRRSIAAWRAIYEERAKNGDDASVTLLHISYTDQAREVSGKAFDFSRLSAEARWQAGYADAARALDAVRGLPFGEPGLAVHTLAKPGGGAAQLERVDWQLAPVLA
jgi:NTE family protein